MTRVLLTVEGAEKLREELARLIKTERPRVIQAIAEARSHGDLSENAEYEAARDEQGFIEGRIAELEGQLSRAEIVDPSKLHIEGRVVFGALVDLYDVEADGEVTYQIVGELEADLEHGRISMSSPIGRALIGKEEGEELEVVTPGGTRGYEVVKVRYK
jgi:transcription elongation factor GreA